MLFYEVSELHGVHAADPRAVLVVFFIAAAHAVNDGDALRLLAVFEHDTALGGARRIDQTLELQAGDYVIQPLVAVGIDGGGVEDLKAGSQDYGTDLDLDYLVFLLKIYSLSLTELLAGAALTALEIGAVLPVDNRYVGHRLGEGAIDCLSLAQPGFELAVHLPGALLLANAAARAKFFVDVARLLPDFDLEVADISRDLFYFTVGQQLNERMGTHLRHLGGQNTSGAVQGGEGLIQLRHMPADTGGPFHQIDLVLGIGDFKRRLDAGNTPTHHQGIGIDRHFFCLQRLVVIDPPHRGADQRFGFLGSRLLVFRYPGNMLADISHLKEIGI
ncbi:hypothetical protein ES703_94788 [subsurface metagenome]